MAGRDGEAIAKFDEAMGIEPDHLTVLLRACEFTRARDGGCRRRGRSPIGCRGSIRGPLRSKPSAPGSAGRDWRMRRQRLRQWRAQLSGFRGGPAALLGATPSPPRVRLSAPPAAPALRACRPRRRSINSWLRHAATIGAVPSAPVDIVLIGDSLAHQWPAKVWSGRRVYNLGVSGDRTQHVLWRLACFDDGAIEAKAVVLIVGVNNLVSGDDVQSIVEAVGDVIGQARRVAPGAKIAVVVPSAVRSRLPASRRRSHSF